MPPSMNDQAEVVQVQFNGQPLEIPTGTNIEQLLQLAEMRSRVVAVEVNGELVPRAQHTQCCVAAGDLIEAVTLVGGG